MVIVAYDLSNLIISAVFMATEILNWIGHSKLLTICKNHF